MADDILKELLKLESLAGPSKGPSSKSSKSSKSSVPISATLARLEEAIDAADRQIRDGIDVQDVLAGLTREAEASKTETEKGLKEWYSGLSKVGKAIDKGILSDIGAISNTYDNPEPPLFSNPESAKAMNRAILDTMIRKGAWSAAESLCEETGLEFDQDRKRLSLQLHETLNDLARGDVESALEWTSKHHAFLSAPPHPSPLAFRLHRARLIHLIRHPTPNPYPLSDRPLTLQYVQDHMFIYMVSHYSNEIYNLLGALLYKPEQLASSPYAHILSPDLEAPALIPLFRIEFCRLHGWPQEDPLGVVVDLGAGGALTKIEKARKALGARLGEVRTWEELPMELPVPSSRRYHSVFACPVSKEQATETNPPKMLSCGHAIAQDSLTKLSKHGRRAVKCPYCPQETVIASAIRLYF